MSYEKLNLKDGEKFSAEHVSHIEDGIVQNALDLEGKQPVGEYLTPESTIPSGKIVEDEAHRFTTDSEKVKWDSKADGVHGHAMSDVEGLQTALDGKSDVGHTHDDRYYTEAEVDEALAGKSDNGHGHVISDVDGLQGALDGKANSSHFHEIDEVNGLNEALANVPSKVHTHEISDVYGLESELTKINNKIGSKADSVHSHSMGEVTGLQTALEGKSDTDHNHDGVYSPIGHNHDGVYSPVSHNHDGVYAPLVHTHVSADITDLESYVDGRIGVVAGSALDNINGEVI